MLGKLHVSADRLHIPKLKFLQSKSPPNKPESNYYTLGWDAIDASKAYSYNRWVENYWKDAFPASLAGQTPQDLPEPYNTAIKNLVFQIPFGYHEGIIHYSRLFLMEWTRELHFDTVIRDMCCRPAIEAINVAFKLLADCVHDPDNPPRHWLRKLNIGNGMILDKSMIQCLLMYKFWHGTTGRGNVFEHSGLEALERRVDAGLSRAKQQAVFDEERQTHILCVKRMVNEITAWELEQKKFYDFTAIDMNAPPSVLRQQLDLPEIGDESE